MDRRKLPQLLVLLACLSPMAAPSHAEPIRVPHFGDRLLHQQLYRFFQIQERSDNANHQQQQQVVGEQEPRQAATSDYETEPQSHFGTNSNPEDEGSLNHLGAGQQQHDYNSGYADWPQGDFYGHQSQHQSPEEDDGPSYVHSVPVSEHVEVTKPVAVPVYKNIGVPVPHPFRINVPHPYAVSVPQPYPVAVPVSQPVPVQVIRTVAVPVEKKVPYPVEKHIPVPIEKPVPITIEKHIPVPVIKPYPIRIPVYKTIYHHAKHH